MPEPNTTAPKESEAKPVPQDNLVITKHAFSLNGQEIHYTVTTGTIILKNAALLSTGWRN